MQWNSNIISMAENEEREEHWSEDPIQNKGIFLTFSS
jgi:hypothetical protein